MMKQNQKPAPAGSKQGSEVRSQLPVGSYQLSVLFLLITVYCSLFTVLTGCGINKDVYQKTVEESDTRKAGLEQAQKEIARLKDENQQVKVKIDELSKQIEELAAGKEVISQEINGLKSEKEELLSKSEYLNREVERLKLKAGELSTEKEKELAGVKSTYEKLLSEMKHEIEKGDIKITRALDRLSVNMVEKILFDSGKAEIKPEGLKVLDRVGAILKGITDKQIKIEGHTDNVKIGARIKERYPTNWELSTARATSVVRYLQDKVGIDPKLLSAEGYSEYRPIAGNDTTEGRAQNRRMDIVLLPLDLGSVVEELKKK